MWMIAIGIVRTMTGVGIVRTMIAVVTAVTAIICASIHSAINARDAERREGRPIRAWAASRDQPNCFVGDECNEIGAAHKEKRGANDRANHAQPFHDVLPAS